MSLHKSRYDSHFARDALDIARIGSLLIHLKRHASAAALAVYPDLVIVPQKEAQRRGQKESTERHELAKATLRKASRAVGNWFILVCARALGVKLLWASGCGQIAQHTVPSAAEVAAVLAALASAFAFGACREREK